MAANSLEWLLELNAKLDGATKMVRELNRVEDAIGKTNGALQRAERNAKGILPRMAGWFRDVGKAAMGDFLAHLGATAAWDTLKAGVGLVMDLGREMFKAAGEAQRTTAVFRNLFGAAMGDEMEAYLEGITRHTEFTDGALKGFGMTLAKAGIQGETWKDSMAAVLDVAALSEDKMAGATAAVEAFSRIMTTGRFDGRGLKNLGLQPRDVFAQMAKDLGMGVDEVEKRMRDGGLRTQDIMNSLFKGIVATTKRGELGAAGIDMSKLFGARLEKVKDIVPNLFEELSKSKGLSQLSESMGRLVEAFDPGSPLGKKVIGGLEMMLNRFGALLGGVDFSVWADRALKAMELFGAAVEIGVQLGSELMRLGGFFVRIGETIGDFAFGVTQAYSRLVDWGAGALEYLATLPAKINQAALALGTALWTGMRDGLVGWVTGGLAGAVDGLVDGTVGRVKRALGIQSPSRVFAGLGMMTAAGFAAGLAAGQPMVSAGALSTFAPEAVLPASVAGAAYIGAGAAAVSAGGRAAGGNRTVEVGGISVYVDGTTATADEIAEKVAREVPSAIMAALEQMNLQGGIA